MPVERVIKVVAHGTTGLFKVVRFLAWRQVAASLGPCCRRRGPGTHVVDGFLGVDHAGDATGACECWQYVVNDDSTRVPA